MESNANFFFRGLEGEGVTRRERMARDMAIVEARRRGVPATKLATTHELTVRRVQQIAADWDDLPSIPKDGVRVDAGQEVRRTLVAFEQAIIDLGQIVSDERAPVHVKLGAITRTFDAHERRLRLMASAGFIARNLAAPLIEQEMAAWTQGVVEILRRHEIGDEVIGEMVTMARERLGRPMPAIDVREAVAA